MENQNKRGRRGSNVTIEEEIGEEQEESWRLKLDSGTRDEGQSFEEWQSSRKATFCLRAPWAMVLLEEGFYVSVVLNLHGLPSYYPCRWADLWEKGMQFLPLVWWWRQWACEKKNITSLVKKLKSWRRIKVVSMRRRLSLFWKTKLKSWRRRRCFGLGFLLLGGEFVHCL